MVDKDEIQKTEDKPAELSEETKKLLTQRNDYQVLLDMETAIAFIRNSGAPAHITNTLISVHTAMVQEFNQKYAAPDEKKDVA